MTYKLHKNGVITGTLNSFCLACDSFLESEHQASGHVETSPHKKNLNAVPYSDKFDGERIRKFKWGYYCEFCNILLPIAAKVNLHVNEDEHRQNKSLLLLKQMGKTVVAFDNIVVEEKAWHGLIDEICSICNAEYDDENEHKNNASHCLNLVSKPIHFGEANAIYRHLDESSIQCLTCNKLLVPGRMAEHFNGNQHHELYSKCRIQPNGIHNENEHNESLSTENDKKNIESKRNNDFKTKKKTSAEENSKIMESVVKFQSKGININLETETAFCKKCSEAIPFEFVELEKHIENHSSSKKPDSESLYPPNVDQNLNRVNLNDKTADKTEDSDSSAESDNDVATNSNNGEETTGRVSQSAYGSAENSEALAFAKENHLTYKEGSSSAYCQICTVNLPSSLKSMKEHVAGINHTRLVKTSDTSLENRLKYRASPIVKQISKDFVDSLYQIENFFYYETVINEEFCIPQYSFFLISKTSPKWRCLLCGENVTAYRSGAVAHFKTKEHNTKLETVPVITSEESEFIREIRPNLYHCGFCNFAIFGWDELKKHLKCEDHMEKKTHCEDRLQVNLPKVHRHKIEKRMEAMQLMWFLNHL